MLARPPLRAVAVRNAVGLGAGLLMSCGAREELGTRHFGAPLDASAIIGCLGDLDCGPEDRCAPVHCVGGVCVSERPVVCDDFDDCSEDRCIPETGLCEFRLLSLDEDGDGRRGPRTGFLPGEPGACGDDCDDTSPRAFPGGVEVCDGVDNDCNGVVDDGAGYHPSGSEPLLLSTRAKQAGVGGVAFGTTAFAVTLAQENASWESSFTAFDESGRITVPAAPITSVNTDTFTGPIVWTGSLFGVAWEDRRDEDFEIYFNRLDASGSKLSADVRITDAPEFSLRPALLWSGADFVLAWHDRRDGVESGRIYGQRVGLDGAKIGENVALTPLDADADAPAIAKGSTGLGLVWNAAAPGGREIVFRSLSPDLERLGDPVVLGGGGAASSAIAWSGGRYIVVWDTEGAAPGSTLRGASVAEDGAVVVPERDVTAPAPFARSEALLPLGDRLLLVWAEERFGAYSLYSKTITPALDELSPPEALTDGISDSLGPALAFSPAGTVGVVFEDRRSGSFQVYATRLECAP